MGPLERAITRPSRLHRPPLPNWPRSIRSTRQWQKAIVQEYIIWVHLYRACEKIEDEEARKLMLVGLGFRETAAKKATSKDDWQGDQHDSLPPAFPR